ncbi:sulfur carrier protein ThiS [Alcaligenes ammonioxydans]|jgi:sulfur carrier protein|uniref:Sulfur carrier protein ThiS n=1 Tax=Alcaligenes ammonioxydans TaxID=2582914 RepID=A0ABX8SSE3_9BURK|nr:sulfur carrier protein ThiS [Alcaligenes ammonioxydans]EJC61898.1 thiamine biosynthesis protein [Alcaligenes faecalis subsp. faecalis NCIB 8687]QBH19962.1 sulfur carrier protein ThiS [Alcaligenes faecalis]MCH1879141.1 sulfur carrier protein ThiS [Alcaligenes ammonioxydans]QXX77980.1 sulfur carrier protein ThiS [Alcaligenes ammonioxydans]HRK84118.1 sulfur carrier protein ThiS [Alcaligenes faecalis]
MNITLNGQSKTLANSDTIGSLIRELGYENKRIAVELNGDIVPKSQHANTPIKDGDTIEIVVAVGGG